MATQDPLMPPPGPLAHGTPPAWGPRQVGLGLLGLTGLWIGAGLLLAALGGGDPSPRTVMTIALLLELGLLGIAVRFGPWAMGRPASSLGFAPVRRAVVVRYGLLALVGSLAIGGVYVSIVEQMGIDWLVPPTAASDLELGGAMLPGFLAIVAVGPLAEEAFFRGLVFTGLAVRWGVGPAALASAGIFAATHGSLGLLVPAFGSGLVFVWAYRRTGSLWPVVLAHAVQNGAVFAAAV